ncbi:OmpA family protein [Clostridium sp. BJN0001]|uniref:OmpA family protein n=1 Tax=Clostridium sp. BJN0001 TaxID=2930219 RepID=UPI001FD13A6A|nr:OmpA family protein [Clostridium sp. BJN0001]
MARKKKNEGGGLTGNEWLGTYSDCVTLLLTFFILLYSMSTVDLKKTRAISNAFNVMNGNPSTSILEYDSDDGKAPIIGGEAEADLEEKAKYNTNKEQTKKEMYENVKQYMDQNDLNSAMTVSMDSKGVVLQLRDNVLFESGQADLIPSSIAILDKVNTLISTMPNNINIEGHTDNVPISSSRYPSNWELSSARATSVLRYFVDEKGQIPQRFAVSGYGEFNPICENNSDENRAKNRRVNILIISENEESESSGR